MKLAFLAIAGAMIVVALALLLWPMLRAGRREGRPRGIFLLCLLIALALPLAAAGLYLEVGTPVALDGVETAAPDMDIGQAVAALRTHLQQQPDDLKGWLLLAQTDAALGQHAEARDAYGKALQLAPDDPGVMVGWAEADSMARPDHRIEGRARQLLEKAVAADPASQRGLWLLGISQFQQDQYSQAAATWERLQGLLDPGSKVARAVAEQIEAARARAGGGASTAPAPAAGPALHVEVSLAPDLAARVPAGATLFVFARATGEGASPMPLAVARLDAAKLPATVTLGDAQAMTPQHALSTARRVFVGARISARGQAIASPGDLEGDAGVVAVERESPVHIVIDKVHR